MAIEDAKQSVIINRLATAKYSKVPKTAPPREPISNDQSAAESGLIQKESYWADKHKTTAVQPKLIRRILKYRDSPRIHQERRNRRASNEERKERRLTPIEGLSVRLLSSISVR